MCLRRPAMERALRHGVCRAWSSVSPRGAARSASMRPGRQPRPDLGVLGPGRGARRLLPSGGPPWHASAHGHLRRSPGPATCRAHGRGPLRSTADTHQPRRRHDAGRRRHRRGDRLAVAARGRGRDPPDQRRGRRPLSAGGARPQMAGTGAAPCRGPGWPAGGMDRARDDVAADDRPGGGHAGGERRREGRRRMVLLPDAPPPRHGDRHLAGPRDPAPRGRPPPHRSAACGLRGRWTRHGGVRSRDPRIRRRPRRPRGEVRDGPVLPRRGDRGAARRPAEQSMGPRTRGHGAVLPPRDPQRGMGAPPLRRPRPRGARGSAGTDLRAARGIGSGLTPGRRRGRAAPRGRGGSRRRRRVSPASRRSC